jgi:hypothetical protein
MSRPLASEGVRVAIEFNHTTRRDLASSRKT